jgi:hypothetical protein
MSTAQSTVATDMYKCGKRVKAQGFEKPFEVQGGKAADSHTRLAYAVGVLHTQSTSACHRHTPHVIEGTNETGCFGP